MITWDVQLAEQKTCSAYTEVSISWQSLCRGVGVVSWVVIELLTIAYE